MFTGPPPNPPLRPNDRVSRLSRAARRAELLSPQECLERLAAQVPPAGRHMVTYHGVLAPASAYRDQVVPEDRPYREPMHRHRKTQPKYDAAERAAAEAHEEGDAEQASKPKRRSSPWAELLMRTFGFDPLHCSLCGGRRELIALITQPHTAQRILEAMHLPAEPPVLAPARPPPQPRLPFALGALGHVIRVVRLVSARGRKDRITREGERSRAVRELSRRDLGVSLVGQDALRHQRA